MAEREKDIGALWIKTGNNGQYMTGSVEIEGKKIPIVCFLNTNKKESKHPDWRIYISRPREQTTEQQDRAFDRAFDQSMEAPEPTINYPKEDIDPDDIPF